MDKDGRLYKMDETAVGMEVANHQNNQYYATVKIGSNKQYFRLLVDTGSAITWIPSQDCPYE